MQTALAESSFPIWRNLSKAPLTQIADQVHIEFADIEAGDVLPVEIDDVAVGHAAFAGDGYQGVFVAPDRGIHRHQPVIGAVEVPHQKIGHIERELAPGGLVESGSHALIPNALLVGGFRVQRGAAAGGRLRIAARKSGFLSPSRRSAAL